MDDEIGAATQDDQEDFDEYFVTLQQKHDAEMEYYTDLAVRETQRWLETVTTRKFEYPDDPLRSLEDGIILCELLNAIMPGSVKRINRLVSTKMAKMDNLAVFLDTCRSRFGLRVEQLFDVSDLHRPDDEVDCEESCVGYSLEAKRDRERRLRNVAVTVFWLARQLNSSTRYQFDGPELDFRAFSALVAAKSSAAAPTNKQESSADDWLSLSTADQDELARCDSDMSSHDRFSEAQFDASQGDEADDRPAVYSRRLPSGERFPSMDNLNDYGGGRSGSKAGAGVEHRRMQSNDSLDSGCGERGGSVRNRKGSSTVVSDPLQFVQLKPATNLARAAEEALRKAEAAKVMRQSFDRGEEDWQGNLSSWKQKRKSQSSSNLFSSVDAAEVLSESSRPLSGTGFSGGSASNYYRYPYDDQPVVDDLDDSAFQSAPSLDTTMADHTSLPPHRIKSDSDFGSCSPKEEGNNDADLESEGCRSEEDGSYQLQVQQTYGAAPGEPGDKWTAPSRSAAPLKADTQQLSGKMRLTLKPPADPEDGFGFSIKGGIDKCAPITVETVTAGSPADHAGLAETDEVLEIGNEVVNKKTRGYCMLLINNSLKKQARLDLVVQRDPAKVAQALADKKRSSLGTKPKSIIDVYAGISAAPPQQQQTAVNSQDDLSYSSTTTTEAVVATTARTEVPVQRSHIEDNYTSDGISAENADSSRDYADEQPSVAMQSDSAVYTSFVQLRLSTGSPDAAEMAADVHPPDHLPGSSQSRLSRRGAQPGDEDKQKTAGWARDHEAKQEQRQRDGDQRVLRAQYEREQASYETDVLSRQKEREAARERATKKLMELKRRFSSEAPADAAAAGNGLANGRSSPMAADYGSLPVASQHGSERAARAQHTSANGSLVSSKEEELRRKEHELRLMEERLMQERERILLEQQQLLQLREQQQQQRASLQLVEQQQQFLADDRLVQKTQAPVVATPPMSEVYRQYEAVQLPEQLGSRDRTPPRMTRKDVVDLSKKATAASREDRSVNASATTAKQSPQAAMSSRPTQQQQAQQHQQQQQQIQQQRSPTVAKQSAAGSKQPPAPQRQQQDQSRNTWNQGTRGSTNVAVNGPSSPSRKGTSGAGSVTVASRAQRSKEDSVDAPLAKSKAATLDRPSSQSKQKVIDLDPNMPDIVSKEDVLRLMREKPRYVQKAEQLRAERAPAAAADDGGGGRRGGGGVHPLRKAISGFDMRGTDFAEGYPNGGGWRLAEAGSDEVLNKSLDFRASRALFEQQGQAADAYWKERQVQGSQQRKQVTAGTSRGGGGVSKLPQGKSLTLDRATAKGSAWKSNATPAANKSSARVSTWLAASARGGGTAPAQPEWRKELESVRLARQQQRTADDDGIGGGGADPEDDDGGAREKERRLREERHRELASIRQLARGTATGGSLTPDADSDVGLGSSDRDEVQWRRHDEAQMSFESDQSSSRNSQADYWSPPAQQYSQHGKPYGYDDDRPKQRQQLPPPQPALSTTRANGNLPASVLGDRPAAGGDGYGVPHENEQPDDHRRHQFNEGSQDDDDDEGVLSVSAKQLCTYCSEELGRGAAMVIESLNMCYHVDCFRCWACRQPLSDGARGADVRVRDNRLHCKDCYDSNNAGGGGNIRPTALVDDAFL